MNNYQFDFIARALLSILSMLTQIAEHRDPERVSWSNYDELENLHADWQNEHENQ